MSLTTPFSWTHQNIERRTVGYGYGLFSLKPVVSGTRVIAFGGYMLPLEIFLTLPKHIREHPFQVADDLFFGQIAEGELDNADYLNHSCEPNCGFSGQAFVVAMRDIALGEEITIDYAMCTSSAALRNIECRCGTPSCRGTTHHDDWMRKDLQEKYKGYFQPYLEEKIRAARW
jgi:SET domain-containing protein